MYPLTSRPPHTSFGCRFGFGVLQSDNDVINRNFASVVGDQGQGATGETETIGRQVGKQAAAKEGAAGLEEREEI
jgi:hypothetical protein